MADLQEMRERFVIVTNRYDLVDLSGPVTLPNNADNGANRYINAGSLRLDRMLSQVLPYRTKSVAISATNSSVSVAGLIDLESLTIIDGSSDRVDITKKWNTRQQFYHDEAAENPATTTPGKPSEWTIDALSDIDVARTHTIAFRPVSDDSYTLEVYGKFQTDTLTNNTDVNYWSVNYPEALALAAAYELALGYGDLARSELEALMAVIDPIDNEGIEFGQWEYDRGLES